MGGKQHKPQNQSGLGGLASSLLGGQNSHGGGGHGGSGHSGSGGLAGQLVGGLLGGKQHNQQSGQSQHGGHGQGGFMGMASGLLGHHGSSVGPFYHSKPSTNSSLGLG